VSVKTLKLTGVLKHERIERMRVGGSLRVAFRTSRSTRACNTRGDLRVPQSQHLSVFVSCGCGDDRSISGALPRLALFTRGGCTQRPRRRRLASSPMFQRYEHTSD